MHDTQMAIVVTVMPATATKGTRYKGICQEACQVVAADYALNAKANAWKAAQECCVAANLEAREGECWMPTGLVLEHPGKPGSYIVIAKRSLYL